MLHLPLMDTQTRLLETNPTSISSSRSRSYPIDTHFDAEFADDLARLETYNRHLYRPNTYLHKWWARRCGTTFRAILKHLAADPAQAGFYAPGGLAGKLILDPMMGGGTTLHEAIRLEANVIGADLDPIPIVQARASLARLPLADLQAAFTAFHRGVTAVLAPHFQTCCPFCQTATEPAEVAVPLQYLLYGWRKACACGEAVFVDSLALRHGNDGRLIELDAAAGHILRDGAVWVANECTHSRPIFARKKKTCDKCGRPYQEDLSIPFYQRYTPVAVAAQCPRHGLFFAPPRAADRAAIAQADARRGGLGFDPADFAVNGGPKSKALHVRQIPSYLDLFTSRQLLYLRAAMDNLAGLEPAVQLNLALLVSTSLEFNSLLCGYKGSARRRPGAIRHAFAYHAYSFPYMALENNPVFPARTSGTLRNLFYGRIVRGRRWAAQPIERRVANGQTAKVSIPGERDSGQEVTSLADLQTGTHKFMLLQGSSTRLELPDDSVDFIVTDPPYFDSVQYSDLAEFFRVWLRQLMPDGADWAYALTDSAVHPRRPRSDQFERTLAGIFRECRRVLKEDGRFIFTFHHWNPKGWSALTRALRRAGFVLVNRYVVHAENVISRHIVNQNALQHDVILVLAPAGAGVTIDWQKPVIDTETSAGFARDCGTAVGWLLQCDMDEAAIEEAWGALLKVGW